MRELLSNTYSFRCELTHLWHRAKPNKTVYSVPEVDVANTTSEAPKLMVQDDADNSDENTQNLLQ
ncbi:hypothetical protein OkiPb00196_43170 [Escherichia coli]